MTNVLIVDDHPIVVEGLRILFSKPGSQYSCAIAYSFNECIQALKVFVPEVVMLDINLPDGNGMDLCKVILAANANCKIIALSSFSEQSYITRMLENGAKGYLLKNSSEDEIMAAIDDVMSGNVHLGFEIADILDKTKKVTDLPLLTRRESEVLKMIADGLTNQEIADKIFISPLTVDSHRKNLLMKLGAKNTAALVKIAINMGLIE